MEQSDLRAWRPTWQNRDSTNRSLPGAANTRNRKYYSMLVANASVYSDHVSALRAKSKGQKTCLFLVIWCLASRYPWRPPRLSHIQLKKTNIDSLSVLPPRS